MTGTAQTTVVRLAAPLLAWPQPSRYRFRYSCQLPTRSALRGLLAAAAGYGRATSSTWLDHRELVVRADDPGRNLRDFHTISPPDLHHYRWLSPRDQRAVTTVASAAGKPRGSAVVTERFYREGATYLLLIADDDARVAKLLSAPHWAIYAGRKGCPLTFPLLLGRYGGTPEQAAAAVPSACGQGPRTVALFQPPAELEATGPQQLYDRPGPDGDHPQDRWTAHTVPQQLHDWFAVAAWLAQR